MHTGEQAEVLKAGELEIRPMEHLARARGRALSLSVRELELLAREELIEIKRTVDEAIRIRTGEKGKDAI